MGCFGVGLVCRGSTLSDLIPLFATLAATVRERISLSPGTNSDSSVVKLPLCLFLA